MSYFSNVLNNFDRSNNVKFGVNINKENEKKNILVITKLVLNTFLARSLKGHRNFETDTQELSDLLIMIEKIFMHGLKKSVLKKPEQCLWESIVSSSGVRRDLEECVFCITGLESLLTPISRIRAFFRLSVMQKKLGEYVHLLLTSDIFLKAYETWGLVNSDEAESLAGSLLGLGIFDCNLVLDFEHLQEQTVVFDLSSYVKIPTIVTLPDYQAVNETEKELMSVLDQKNYLEEYNRQLLSRLDVTTHSDHKDNVPIDKSLIFTGRIRDLEKSVENLTQKLLKKDESLKAANELAINRLANIHQLEQKIDELEEKITEFRPQQEVVFNQDKTEKIEFGQSVMSEVNRSTDESFLKNELDRKTEQCAELSFVLSDKQKELNKYIERANRLENRCNLLQEQAHTFLSLEKEVHELKTRLDEADEKACDAQKALEELGGHLSESKLKFMELKEEFLPLTEAQWVSDNEVTHCKNCDLAFSVTQRKHHCRNCGCIFCHCCSDFRIKLPSSAKPTRVCEHCFFLLQTRADTLDSTS